MPITDTRNPFTIQPPSLWVPNDKGDGTKTRSTNANDDDDDDDDEDDDDDDDNAPNIGQDTDDEIDVPDSFNFSDDGSYAGPTIDRTDLDFEDEDELEPPSKSARMDSSVGRTKTRKKTFQ